MSPVVYCGNMCHNTQYDYAIINDAIINDAIVYNTLLNNLYLIIPLFTILFTFSLATYVDKPKNKKKPIIISIEGNIGTGKSTLIEKIQDYFEHVSTNIKFGYIPEPVNIWNSVTDDDGVTILEKYYEDQHKYAFPFQMMAYISRLSIMREVLLQDYDVIIMERSMFTDCEVFAKMLYDDKKIETIEYNIYRKWFAEFIGDFPTISHIYIQAEPNVSAGRVVKRGRQGENIPLSYLEKCHEYHEQWLLEEDADIGCECETFLLLDGNKEMTDADYNEWLDQIEEFIHSKFPKDNIDCY